MQIININDEKYPKLLRIIKNPPKKLYVEGDVELLNKDLFAIIGSRNYTEYGKNQAERFAKKISKSGIGIVSGMAIGIDTFAHIETIKNGGKTVAVLGSGFNYIYPKENRELFNMIIKTGGVVISEYPPNTQMQKKNFPRRNRIVSGLCLGTLVVEATYRSGTSITANFTIEQKRKLYCIPNSIDNKNSCGTINMLKNGATLVSKPEDILKDLGVLNNKVQINKKVDNIEFVPNNKKSKIHIDFSNCDDISRMVVSIIQHNTGIDTNMIAQMSKLTIQNINSILTNLEIEGLVENYAGCKYRIVGDYNV